MQFRDAPRPQWDRLTSLKSKMPPAFHVFLHLVFLGNGLHQTVTILYSAAAAAILPQSHQRPRGVQPHQFNFLLVNSVHVTFTFWNAGHRSGTLSLKLRLFQSIICSKQAPLPGAVYPAHELRPWFVARPCSCESVDFLAR
jgi:hypothetical protein